MVYFKFEAEEHFHSTWSPIIDVYERPGEIIVRVETPGVQKKDIQLRWREGVLTVAGSKRRQPSDEEGVRFLCVERNYGYFRRDVAISADIDFDNATAELREGLLSIRLPKVPDHSRESVIPIE